MPGTKRIARYALFLCGVSVLLILPACGGSSTQSPTRPTPSATSAPPSGLFTPRYATQLRGDVAYGPAPLETLDLCQPVGAPGPLPGLVLIHGGSSTVGDKRAEFDVQGDTLLDLCKGLASQGFLVASINYRLAHADPWPAQVEDGQLAVRWLRAHQDELHLDGTHLCSVGLSSGAYLAVFLGALSTTLPGDRAGDLANQSSHASCVADFYGPVDLATWYASSPESQPEIRDLLRQATPQSDPALYQTASPLNAISATSAPMVIVQGTNDTTVPEAQSRALEQALRQRQVAVQYISYQGDHVFAGLAPDQVRAILGQVVAFIQAH
ncbi:MAG TPA: alpha/beta hydrolase [Ktedonobacterales bacterium]|nr:alpha/beta hydrolase [Ktedonobacterales bacterium]